MQQRYAAYICIWEIQFIITSVLMEIKLYRGVLRVIRTAWFMKELWKQEFLGHSECLCRKEDVYISYSQQKAFFLERTPNEYGKRIRCAAEGTSEKVSEECLRDQKEEFMFQWSYKSSGAKKINLCGIVLSEQNRKVSVILFEISALFIYLFIYTALSPRLKLSCGIQKVL